MSEDNRGGSPKLNEHQAKVVLLLHELGVKQTAIAEIFDLTPNGIWNIVHGKSWKHLTTEE